MEQKRLRVGLIGYGLVGQDVARLIAEQAAERIALVGALVRVSTAVRPPSVPPLVTTLAELLANQPEVIVEVAGHGGVAEHSTHVLRAGIDLVLTSVGALADPEMLAALLDAARRGGARIKIASGAIGGLDALAAASLGGLTRVTHTMRKSPRSLLALEEAEGLTAAQELFQGSARQAAQRFPEFLNVAAAVAMAGTGFDQTVVRVIADPAVEQSVHEVLAEGTFGTFHFRIENEPVGLSARGARLVAMSIVHILLQRSAPLVVG